MWAALLAQYGPVVARMAFTLLVNVLQKTGVLNNVEAGAAKAEHAFVGTVEHLKTYQDYSINKNDPFHDGPQA